MAISSSQSVLRQVHRLFSGGAVGGMTDAQLLNRFVSRRDEAAEAAFEEVVLRHGPMVFRVCQSGSAIRTTPRTRFRPYSWSSLTGHGRFASAGRLRAGCLGWRTGWRPAPKARPRAAGLVRCALR